MLDYNNGTLTVGGDDFVTILSSPDINNYMFKISCSDCLVETILKYGIKRLKLQRYSAAILLEPDEFSAEKSSIVIVVKLTDIQPKDEILTFNVVKGFVGKEVKT